MHAVVDEEEVVEDGVLISATVIVETVVVVAVVVVAVVVVETVFCVVSVAVVSGTGVVAMRVVLCERPSSVVPSSLSSSVDRPESLCVLLSSTTDGLVVAASVDNSEVAVMRTVVPKETSLRVTVVKVEADRLLMLEVVESVGNKTCVEMILAIVTGFVEIVMWFVVTSLFVLLWPVVTTPFLIVE